MIRDLRIGRTVRIHYRVKPHRRGQPAPASFMPWHGIVGGVIVAVSNGRPRNVLVKQKIGGYVVVPCGNLEAWDDT